MAQYIEHAKNSQRIFGGSWRDYIEIHAWLDDSKRWLPTWQHRALRHHTLGIKDAIALFGHFIVNSSQQAVSVQLICEQHIKEDCAGRVPTPQDWLSDLSIKPFALPSKGATKLQLDDNGLLTLSETNQPSEN